MELIAFNPGNKSGFLAGKLKNFPGILGKF